jgi:SPX domain protein involved in polyphosphate accumulation
VKDFAFLEIKRRFIDIVVKERAKFHTTELEELFEEGHRLLADHSPVPYKSRLVAGKFLYSLVKMPLLPTLLVVYEREAFLHPLARYQRATVDMNMRYVMHPDLVDLFHTDGAVRWNQPNAILELKFNDFMPKWMRRLEAEYGLRQQAISKYCYGIDVCQQDIHKEVSACRQTFWKLSS